MRIFFIIYFRSSHFTSLESQLSEEPFVSTSIELLLELLLNLILELGLLGSIQSLVLSRSEQVLGFKLQVVSSNYLGLINRSINKEGSKNA